MGLPQAGHSPLLIKRCFQRRVLQDEGARLGKADKTFRLFIRAGEEQAGVLPVQVQ
nr:MULTISPECIES: hypothetical protein [Pseudomonas]